MKKFVLLTFAVVLPLVTAGPALAAPTIEASWSHGSVISPSGEFMRTCEVTAGFRGFPANSEVTIVAASEAYGEIIRVAVPFGASGSFGAIVVFSPDFRPFPPGDITVTTFIDSNSNRVQDPTEPTLATATLRGLCEPQTKDECRGGRFREFALITFKNQGDCISYVAAGTKNRPAG